MYDPAFEHENCGVGFVANINNIQSHSIVSDGITILKNLTHRGASGCDPKTGDGAGIMLQVPDEFLRKKCARINIELPKSGDYGVGLIFLPTISIERNLIERWFERTVREEGQVFLGWRHVPRDSSHIGDIARSVEPEIKQVFIGRGHDTTPEEFERRLYIIRKQAWKKVNNSDLYQKNYFYICGLSTRTLVYKGQLLAEQLDKYYPDLADSDLKSALAVVHSRYSTNTFPTWALAHPYRMIAHNGEINALRGNINWMKARETSMYSELYGEEFEKVLNVIAPNKSDSATFDNVLEMLVMCGRPLPHAMMMMIPEAWNHNEEMNEKRRDFYKYHACLMEPWDGPASMVFTDGRYIGALLDRNGLRPSRYWITKDGNLIAASETGVLQIPDENICSKNLLSPGKMLLIDLEEKRIVDDEELKNTYASRRPYGQWLKENLVELDQLSAQSKPSAIKGEGLSEKKKVFGYTDEDVKYHIMPMATEAAEEIGSMGNDTPPAVLSEKPQILFNYFHQLFAQVTNPPIDPIREEMVMSSDIYLGGEGNLLSEVPENCRRLRLKNPIITNEELAKIKTLRQDGLRVKTLNMTFRISDGKKGLEKALIRLFKEADIAIDDGYSLLILSDRNADKDRAPIPSLLACSGLSNHLLKEYTRTKASIIIETAEARELHHFAALIGFGAEAVNPYMVFDVIACEIQNGNAPGGLTPAKANENYIKAAKKGLYKIISKMGISTLQSYCGAQIFEAVGLSDALIEKYFTATVSRLGGIGIMHIADDVLSRHRHAYTDAGMISSALREGVYQWRSSGEHHQWNPETIALLQQAVRNNDYSVFKKFSSLVNGGANKNANIRNLLRFKKRTPVDISEVEPVSEIVRRFATGAMSYGSLSKEAHETLARAMNKLGGFSNTGEGGEDPARYRSNGNGITLRSRIKQVAPGRFGVTIEYLVNADQIQIKMAQGAKPGEGGQLPGHKVSEEIARTRHTIPGVGLISPPPHHDIYSIEDLAQLIHDLKCANRFADISVKLVSEAGVGTVAAGVAKAKADHILISGYEGGTGASPLTSIKHTGLPLELGIAEAQQVLLLNELRGRVRLQADGQLKTGRDVVITGMLGADEFGFATSALISMGCIMLRKCHQNICSTGIATQDEELRKNFQASPEHVINFFTFIAQEVREIMASLGFRKFDDLIGRSDLLEADDSSDIIRKKGIDLMNVLHRLDVPGSMPQRHAERQQHDLEGTMDMKLIEYFRKSVVNKIPGELTGEIKNTDLTVGTMLSSEIASRYGIEGLPAETIRLNFRGSAGQSLGAFLARGITIRLEGDANDYVGKGLSGGKIIIHPSRSAAFDSSANVIVGNAVLYGAIKGEAYFSGSAGVRFAVRNSGASAVVEGLGDHGCEYMTGGTVVVLGQTGRNFAAGMSGGIAYVWNKDGRFESRCNPESVRLFPVENEQDKNLLFTLINNHYSYTGSRAAKYVLDRWDGILSEFVKVFPVDYMKVLGMQEQMSLAEVQL